MARSLARRTASSVLEALCEPSTTRSGRSRSGESGGSGSRSKTSSAAEWTVDGTSGSFTLTNRETGRTLSATFPAATGCADYPEAGIDATGTTFKGTDPDGVVQAFEVLTPPVGRNPEELIRQIKAYQHVRATGEVMPSGWQPGDPTLTPAASSYTP